MGESIKIAIIGAGSATFSMRVITDLCLTESLHGSRVCMMDVDARRLEMIHRLAQRLSMEHNSGLRLTKTLHRQDALADADFVINTAQIGGHDWTEAQRTMAEKHGYYRGARLQDYGQMELMLEIARDIERICPDAWLIQSSNPVFEGCTYMTRESGVNVVGLCHGHFRYKDIALVLGLEQEEVSARMPGFNHWIWMTEFRYRGEDAYSLIDDWIETKSETYWREFKPRFNEHQMSPAAIHQYKLYGYLPIGDTPRVAGWWYNTDLETKQKWYTGGGGFDSEIGWAEYLSNIGKEIEDIERAATDESKAISDYFEPVKSTEQIVPLINSIANDEPATYQVNIPNHGPLIPGFPEDLVVEVQAVADGGGIHGMAEPRFPQKLFVGAMIPRWHQAELKVESLRTGDRDLLLNFLLCEQRTRSLPQAERLLDEWLSDPRNGAVKKRLRVG